MKTASAGLISLLNSGTFVFCDLYQFTLSSGQVLRYTTADADVIYGGNTYSSALFFDQTGNKAVAHWKTGFDVDSWQVYIMPVDVDPVTGATFPITIGSQPWLSAVAAGALDGATVDIHRAYWSAWPNWTSPFNQDTTGAGVLVDYFAGRVAAVDVMRNQAIVTINSWLDQFTRLMPRNLWGAACRHTLFDAGCTLTQASFAHNYTAGGGSTQSSIVIGAGPIHPSFALGQMTFTSGANNGFRRMVKSYDGNALSLIAPFPFAVTVGDSLTAYPGCDKTRGGIDGCTGFANTVNFGGQDLIPSPETAV